MLVCVSIAINILILPKEGKAAMQDWIPCLFPSNGWYFRCNPHMQFAAQAAFHISFNAANVGLNHVTYYFQGKNYKFYPVGLNGHYNFRIADIPNHVLSAMNQAWADYNTPP
jgi:hypothetical protein